jgi:diguanylate cyclase (GGDEF)-like protein
MEHYRQVLRETRRSAALIRERQRALINIGVSCNKRASEMDADDPRRPALWRREARLCRAVESTRPELTYSLIAGLNRVGALLNLARLNEAQAELERLAPDARAAGLAEFDGHLLAARARLAKAMGDPMQGASLLESAIDTLGRLGTNETIPGLLEELSDIHEQAGRHDLALVALRESVRRHREVERVSSRHRTLVLEALHRVRVMQVALAEAEVLAASNAAQLSKVQTEAERLLAAAHTDPLTGLGNRRALEVMADSLDRTAMGGYGVVMADLDHFKRINDRFSHAAGDAVLRQVAVLLRDCCRATDGVFRMGGEELVMILPRCTLSKAVAHGERMRAAIERHAWSTLGLGLAVTASFGVAEAAEGESLKCALARADRAMYHAKHAGRNRVISLPAASPGAGIDGFEGEQPIGTRTH